MGVIELRVDNRLIHGQVTLAWVGYLGVDRLVVANDEVAVDEFQRMLLPQSARGVPTAVLGIRDAVEFCRDPLRGEERVMVIARQAEDAFRLVLEGLPAAAVNVGNAAPEPGTDFVMVTRSVAVTREQAAGYRELAQKVEVVSQLMPTDKRTDFIGLLDKKSL
ncbi:PTS N'-diacetylchitobiose transporter subunit IIC [Lentzea sp. NBRC 105346]|uniref:PTS system mannose/fructose/N-acetylgalactosamine-transporter subunit IIB n=1 Tax=Lentzea sp. NBRC 105346 TaxID=3032205 RepID=UPI0024A19445|nr:PTS sugar transporter subunit IIB [Lentzea sp. NBRC 105346]GLZ31751.1 PTS N'-diacetylchitobiose transporter subunit IIC [Lentzea sp. NBRC 105346]